MTAAHLCAIPHPCPSQGIRRLFSRDDGDDSKNRTGDSPIFHGNEKEGVGFLLCVKQPAEAEENHAAGQAADAVHDFVLGVIVLPERGVAQKLSQQDAPKEDYGSQDAVFFPDNQHILLGGHNCGALRVKESISRAMMPCPPLRQNY